MPGDGLCVLHSVQEILKEKLILLSVEELSKILRDEVTNNDYSQFACPEDLVASNDNNEGFLPNESPVSQEMTSKKDAP